MRPQSLSPPLQALYRVFVLPTLQCQSRTPASPNIATRAVRSYQAASGTPTTALSSLRPHARAFTTTCRRNAGPPRAPEKRSQLWDEEIPARFVSVVDPETNTLRHPQRLTYVLTQFDRKTHRLVCFSSPPSPTNERGAQEDWVPTCKIVSKKEQYQAEKAKLKARKEAKKLSKTDSVKAIELSWAVDQNDLGHRMRKMVEFLEEGRRVEVLLAKKKGGRKATMEECQHLVDTIQETVTRVAGAKELADMEGKLGGVATLSFEGPKKKPIKQSQKLEKPVQPDQTFESAKLE